MNVRNMLAAALSLAPVAALVAATLPAPAAAQEGDGFYLSASVGLTSAFGADVAVMGANRPTRCDRLLYTNPADAPTDGECGGPFTFSSLGGFDFGRSFGNAQSVAAGYAKGSLRLEVELLTRSQAVEAAPWGVGDNASLAGKGTEWSALDPPHANMHSLRSVQGLVNAYLSFRNASDWTPYVGGGGGFARLRFWHYMTFLRKSIDEGYLEVFGGSKSNPGAAPDWQRAAAGSLSLMEGPVSETVLAYQVLAGIDRHVAERTTIGLKARWTHLQSTRPVPIQFNTIRTHAPVHSDGRTPFIWDFEFSGLGYLGATLEVRHGF